MVIFPTMKLIKSRIAIDDCKVALSWFEREPIAEEFRLILVLCLTMLRTVGYIIERECKSDEKLNIIQQHIWMRAKHDLIFLYFIKKFRDNVIKEFRAPVNWASITLYESKEHRMEYLISDYEYKGRDVRSIIEESIEWWIFYISKVEAEYGDSNSVELSSA